MNSIVISSFNGGSSFLVAIAVNERSVNGSRAAFEQTFLFNPLIYFNILSYFAFLVMDKHVLDSHVGMTELNRRESTSKPVHESWDRYQKHYRIFQGDATFLEAKIVASKLVLE